jgi:hypothetical protein
MYRPWRIRPRGHVLIFAPAHVPTEAVSGEEEAEGHDCCWGLRKLEPWVLVPLTFQSMNHGKIKLTTLHHLHCFSLLETVRRIVG